MPQASKYAEDAELQEIEIKAARHQNSRKHGITKPQSELPKLGFLLSPFPRIPRVP
jgi:hypothetical protein